MAGIKWIASAPDNIHKGLERASALIALNDADTGQPRAILEGFSYQRGANRRQRRAGGKVAASVQRERLWDSSGAAALTLRSPNTCVTSSPVSAPSRCSIWTDRVWSNLPNAWAGSSAARPTLHRRLESLLSSSG